MRAVIYCRVSSLEQTKNLSLPTQEQACREYASRHGYDVDEIFIDAGESAKTIDRTEFRRLLEHCRRGRGRLHAVIVYSLTRFSRNSADHHAIKTLLVGLGISLRSVTEPIDDTPSGKLMEGILAAMAQWDNEVRTDRMRAGVHAAVDRGRWCWPAPIGYVRADARRGPSLVPDPVRAPLVAEVFRLYDAGVQGRELLRRMQAMGLTATRGGRAITSLQTLNTMLRHRAYLGYVQPKGWPRETRGDFAPIVPEDLFARVQARLNGPTRARQALVRHRNHPDFPLRRFVRCACGKSLTGSWSRGRTGTRYAFYHCPAGCTNIAKTRLETAFLALLDTLKPRPAYWRTLEAAIFDVWKAEHRQAAVNLGAIRQHIAALEVKSTRLDEAYLYDRTIDELTYQTQRDTVREDIMLARLELTQAAAAEMDIEGMLAFARHALTHASAIWSTAGSLEDRLRAQWTFFPDGLALAATAIGNTRARRQASGPQPVTANASVTMSADDKGLLETFQQPSTCLRIFELQPRDAAASSVVGLQGLTWKQITTWLVTIGELQRAA